MGYQQVPRATLDKIEFDTPDWVPLHLWCQSNDQDFYAVVGYWMWMYRKDGFEHYKHSLDRHYLVLDGNGLPR